MRIEVINHSPYILLIAGREWVVHLVTNGSFRRQYSVNEVRRDPFGRALDTKLRRVERYRNRVFDREHARANEHCVRVVCMLNGICSVSRDSNR